MLAREAGIHPEERLEDLRQRRDGNADARVAHRDAHALGSRCGRDPEGSSLRRELHRVAQEVAHDLGEAQRIALDQRQLGFKAQFKVQTLLGSPTGDRLAGLGQEHIEIHHFPLDSEGAGLHLSGIQQGFHQFRELGGPPLNLPNVGFLGGRELSANPVLEQLEVSDHAGERGSQLVADRAEKAPLELLQAKQLLVLGLETRVGRL
ncbi:hypothetical protein D3C86_1321080 [compost metagenome]